jgi:hypothetical protein
MVPLPALVVPAAPVILLPGALPWCLRSLTGLLGPCGFCRCLRLLKFICHIVQTD